MVAFIVLLLLQTAPAPRFTIDVEASGEAMRDGPFCLSGLPMRRSERRVIVRCHLDSTGTPTECEVRDQDPSLTPAYRAAAICIAQTMRLKDPSGARATDRTLNLPVMIRMDQPPPSGFVPPPVD